MNFLFEIDKRQNAITDWAHFYDPRNGLWMLRLRSTNSTKQLFLFLLSYCTKKGLISQVHILNFAHLL